MIKPNTILKTVTGRILKIIALLGAGREGVVAKARDLDNPKEVKAVKIFHPDHTNADAITRTKDLCAQKLNEACPALIAPEEFINDSGYVGYTMQYVQGTPLIDFLETAKPQFMQLLVFLALMDNGIAR